MQIRKILVVDDSASQRQILAHMLTRHGFEVTHAESAEQAFALVSVAMPDLILMDVVMPGINGYSATRMLQRNPETHAIPVILCTTKSSDSDRFWGLRQGAVDYLVKPVEEAALISKIQALEAVRG